MMTGYHNLTAVECENEVLRGRLKELKEAALALCDAVTRYVEPKKGDKYLGRLELLNINRSARDVISGGGRKRKPVR